MAGMIHAVFQTRGALTGPLPVAQFVDRLPKLKAVWQGPERYDGLRVWRFSGQPFENYDVVADGVWQPEVA
jgi:hypothetical protein